MCLKPLMEMHWVYQSRNIAPEELPLEARLARLDPDAQARIERVLMETLAKEQAQEAERRPPRSSVASA
jgi:hypothetical protein